MRRYTCSAHLLQFVLVVIFLVALARLVGVFGDLVALVHRTLCGADLCEVACMVAIGVFVYMCVLVCSTSSSGIW